MTETTLSLSDIQKALESEGVNISERSLARYRNDFPHFQAWEEGPKKKRRYSKESIEAFRLVALLFQDGLSRDEIEAKLNSEFFTPVAEDTDTPDTVDSQSDNKPVALPNIVERQQTIIEELVKTNAELKNANQLLIQLLSNQETRLQQLEDTVYRQALDFKQQPKERWWHRWFSKQGVKGVKAEVT